MAVAVACSTPEKHGAGERDEEHLGHVASALSTHYEAEDMSWSGVDGEDGIIETNPAPTHRYIWSNSVLSQAHTFVGGSTTITVRAMGELLDGVGPHIVVTAGAVEVGSAYVNETSWTDKTFTFTAPVGAQEIRVTFDNDDSSATEDRNLLVDWVDVSEPDSPPTSCSDTTYRAELMPWTGTEGTDGEVSTDPPPTHRYFWQDSSIYEAHTFRATRSTRTAVA